MAVDPPPAERSVPSSARARANLRLAEAYERVHEADRRPVLALLAHHFAGASGAAATPKAIGDRGAHAFALGCRVRGLMPTGRMAAARHAVQVHERAAREGRFVLYRYMALSFEVMVVVIDGREA